jgi:hypothetical protein
MGKGRDWETKLRGLSPSADYTDRATAAFGGFSGYRVSRGQSSGSLRPHSRLSRPEPLLSEVKRQLRKHIMRWEDAIKMDPEEMR